MESDIPGKIRLKESRERRRKFLNVQSTEIDVMSMLFGLYDWTKGKRCPSTVGRRKYTGILISYLFTGGGKGGAGLILFTNYCAGICPKYFLFYFLTTHILFLSATATLEIGLSYLYENTSNLIDRFKCDFCCHKTVTNPKQNLSL